MKRFHWTPLKFWSHPLLCFDFSFTLPNITLGTIKFNDMLIDVHRMYITLPRSSYLTFGGRRTSPTWHLRPTKDWSKKKQWRHQWPRWNVASTWKIIKTRRKKQIPYASLHDMNKVGIPTSKLAKLSWHFSCGSNLGDLTIDFGTILDWKSYLSSPITSGVYFYVQLEFTW